MNEGEVPSPQPTPRIQLTERDHMILLWIGEQYVINLRQLRVLLARGKENNLPPVSESAAYVWITRMKTLGVIEVVTPFRGWGPFLWLTSTGLRFVGLEFKAMKPAVTTLKHLYWCGQARLFLAQRRPLDTWQSERYLRFEQVRAGKKLDDVRELPDGHLVTEKGLIAIEVELVPKEVARVVGIMTKRVEAYGTTWYFCSQESHSVATKAHERLMPGAAEHIKIYDLSVLE